MYPASCTRCGKTLTSKTQHTHHRRLCRAGMVERIAALIDMPARIEAAEHFKDRTTLAARRLDGLPPGMHFVVTHERGTEVKELKAFATAAEAAAHFLTQLDRIREELK